MSRAVGSQLYYDNQAACAASYNTSSMPLYIPSKWDKNVNGGVKDSDGLIVYHAIPVYKNLVWVGAESGQSPTYDDRAKFKTDERTSRFKYFTGIVSKNNGEYHPNCADETEKSDPRTVIKSTSTPTHGYYPYLSSYDNGAFADLKLMWDNGSMLSQAQQNRTNAEKNIRTWNCDGLRKGLF